MTKAFSAFLDLHNLNEVKKAYNVSDEPMFSITLAASKIMLVTISGQKGLKNNHCNS
jgi:hypothetical protein